MLTRTEPPSPIIQVYLVKESDVHLTRNTVYLSSSECKQFSAIANPEVRASARKSRWLLRALLVERLSADPTSVEFLSIRGKPQLLNRDIPKFSLSRSSGWIAVALGDVAVGIDIETVVENTHNADAIEVAFHPEEKCRLALIEKQNRTTAFYEHWTQKEAYAKGIGLGAGIDFSRVIVPAKGGLIKCEIGWTCEPWYTRLVHTEANLQLALAAPVSDMQIVMAKWPPGKNS